ncbi:hypothetical protein AMAG_16287 [Allomyces macrogynus ATCC 38327]|uniref:Uncharacterized protein n=1 Tax=Allomyces macrogynus (strain ATCC 38327) TaxID=578462 RepID=A0A0L0TAS8_ALLM3|nr:hypothetical protein AMAG_16287 [Allomyces macrogynus ATCC 38327]|eukprot:KNE71857.1 hypothetical protein AMAG_16287 [Allomyces macrogynus ATCC 38327]
MAVATATAVELDEGVKFDTIFPTLSREMQNVAVFGLGRGCTPYRVFGLWTPSVTLEATRAFNHLDELIYAADLALEERDDAIDQIELAVHDDPESEGDEFALEIWPELREHPPFEFTRVFPHLAKWVASKHQC